MINKNRMYISTMYFIGLRTIIKQKADELKTINILHKKKIGSKIICFIFDNVSAE